MSDTDKLNQTILDLETYITDLKNHYSDRLSETDKSLDLKNLIPKKELILKSNKYKKQQQKKAKNIQPDINYASEPMPYLSLQTVSDALAELDAYRKLRAAEYNAMVIYLSDDGRREVWFFHDMEEAKAFSDKMFNESMDEIMEEDRLKCTYIDEGTGGELLYPPTPSKYVNDDESFKSRAIADDKVHIVKDDIHYAIYNEETDETRRWDIFDISEKKIPDDIDF